MSPKATNNLTDIVENKLLSLIENEEVAAFDGKETLRSENYVKLADLYHFHKAFDKEEEILTRFSESSFANNEELMDIYERIEKVSKTRHVLNRGNIELKPSPAKNPPAPNKPASGAAASETKNKESFLERAVKEEELALQAIESEPDIVEISSNANVVHKNKNTETALEGLTITVLAVCAVYTGRLETDEIVELSLVLFEYTEGKENPFSVLKTYTGNRKTLVVPPSKVLTKFSIEPDAYLTTPLNKETVLSMFLQADYVVSHNNPNVERKLLITLFPEIIDANWHSTQKDIPWRALGFESVGLSHIVKSFGKRKPRGSLERAKAISQVLQQEEPSNHHPYIERIHYMKPMKSIEWTKEMERQNKRMAVSRSKGKVIVGVIVVVAIAAAIALKVLNFF